MKRTIYGFHLSPDGLEIIEISPKFSNVGISEITIYLETGNEFSFFWSFSMDDFLIEKIFKCWTLLA